MVFDFDDFHQRNHNLERLLELKKINPEFKVTLFAVPALGSYHFWESLPDWMELAVHGWNHWSTFECRDWSANYLATVLDEPVIRRHFVSGFKAPGWQISDGCYHELLRRGWWVADQHLEDARRPPELRTYFYEDGNWHGHIQDWGSNGIEETWPELCDAVRNAETFEFASEAAR